MGRLDERVTRSLDMLAPPRPGPDRWDAIVAAAGAGRRARRRWIIQALPAAGLAVAIALVALAWPLAGGPQGTMIDRAAAAIGDEPVLHAVFTQSAPSRPQLVSLSTGQPVRQTLTNEVWFDASRDIKKTMTSLNGERVDVLVETREGGFSMSGPVYTCAWIARHPVEATAAGVSCRADMENGSSPRDVPEQAPRLALALAGFVDRYQAALASGQARKIGEGEVDGRDVIWLRIRGSADSQLPDTQDVAIDASSYKPVLIRPFDGSIRPIRVEAVDTEPYDRLDFTRSAVRYAPSAGQVMDQSEIAPETALKLLHGRALWLGEEWRELRLLAVMREELITRYPPASGREPSHSVGVAFEYAAPAADGTTSERTAVIIRQSTDCELAYRWSCTAYDPRDGMILAAPVHSASILRRDGLYVSITDHLGQTSPVELARALTPVRNG